ncbi:MAG: DUF4426 domain-containing protein [Pseudomonadota bacterium]
MNSQDSISRLLITHCIALTAIVLSALLSTPALANSTRDFGDHVVHCKALSSTALDATVAERLQITPDESLGLINVAIMRKTDSDAMGESVSGRVTAHWSDLSGMMGAIPMREVRDKNMIFYVGEVDFTAGGMYTFDILISIDDSRPPYQVTFNKQFSDS